MHHDSHILHRQLRGRYPIAVCAQGCFITDASGKRYLDASGGAAVSCLGHGHPDVLAAMHAQIERIAYAHTSFFSTEVAEQLADVLIAGAPASQFFQVAAKLEEGDRLVFVIAGQTLEGEERNKTVALRMGPRVDDPNPLVAAPKRLAEADMTVSGMGEMLQVANVRFGSTAAKARIEQGFEIVAVKVPTDRINAHWFYIPGLLLAALIWWMQGLRMRRASQPVPA